MKASKMKDMGKSFLVRGMDIHLEWNSDRLPLSQSQYASKIITRFNMESAKGMSTSMGIKQEAVYWSGLVPHEIYREAVGA